MNCRFFTIPIFILIMSFLSHGTGNCFSAAPIQNEVGGVHVGESPDSEIRLVTSSSQVPQEVLKDRLLLTATLIVVALGQLSVLFGYLKIEHATRGFYSGRVQSIAVVASVAVFAIGYLFYIGWTT